MSNQLSYYSFTITTPDDKKTSVTYTTRSLTYAKMRAEKYAKEIQGIVDTKYIKSPTPLKPKNTQTEKLLQNLFF